MEAITISNIAIIDTGFLTITTASGTQATMANSGNAMNLKSAEIVFQSGGNVDDSSIINSNSETALNFGSINNAKITVQGLMSRDNTADMDLLDDLDDLIKTLGIKLLYYTSITDGFRDITDSIGSTDVTHLSGTTPHIHVRVINFTARQIANTKILRYKLEMQKTG